MSTERGRTGVLFALAIGLAALGAAPATGQTFYWDTSTSAGYQHGDGAWSDNLWSSNATTLEAWADGGAAKFSATAAGSSTIMLDGMGVTCSGLDAGGANYTLIVTNGGRITSTTGNFIWGYGSATNRLMVLGGPGVTSRISHVGTFWVGYAGNTHELIVDGLGVSGTAFVTNNGQFLIGYTSASSRSSRVTVRRGGRLAVTGGNLIVGRSGDEQQLLVEDGGFISGSPLYLGNSGGHSNRLVVTGSNTVVDQVTILYVANDTNLKGNRLLIADGAVVANVAFRIGNNGCMDNTLSVTNGGRLHTTSNPVNIGYLGATGNMALVTGNQSLWDLGGNALEIGDVGQSASGNVVVITDGGCLTNASVVTVVSNNALRLLGGSLIAGRIVATGEVALAVGDGVQSAALILTNKALASASSVAPGLRVENHGVLAGSATLSPGPSGVVVAAGGVLAPGIGGVGTITNIGDLTLEPDSALHFEIATNTAPGTGWDFLAVTNGALALGGTLKPVLKAGFVPLATDRFLLMTNRGPGSVSGTFDDAGHGQTVLAYDEAGGKPSGSFTLEVGAQAVALTGFRVRQQNGVLIILQ